MRLAHYRGSLSLTRPQSNLWTQGRGGRWFRYSRQEPSTKLRRYRRSGYAHFEEGAGTTISSQAAHPRRGAAHGGELRQAAGAAAAKRMKLPDIRMPAPPSRLTTRPVWRSLPRRSTQSLGLSSAAISRISWSKSSICACFANRYWSEKLIGLRITAHQFRHAAGALILQRHPGNYELLRTHPRSPQCADHDSVLRGFEGNSSNSDLRQDHQRTS